MKEIGRLLSCLLMAALRNGVESRQENTEDSSLVGFAFDGNEAAVLVDNPPGNRKSQAAASLFSGEERTKEPPHVLGKNPESIVSNCNAKLARRSCGPTTRAS